MSRQSAPRCDGDRKSSFRATPSISIPMDAGDRSHIDSVVDEVARTLGPVQLLVNNAAINVLGGIFDYDPADWDWCLRVNLSGPWYLCRRVMPLMREAGGGVIVNVSTYAGRIGWHELLVRTSSGARLTDSTVGTKDVADELRSYPGGLLKSPLHVTSATATWTPGSGAGAVAPLTADPESTVKASSPSGLSGLLDGDLSVGVVILALLLAMGWGALHSLSPGHGCHSAVAANGSLRSTQRPSLQSQTPSQSQE